MKFICLILVKVLVLKRGQSHIVPIGYHYAAGYARGVWDFNYTQGANKNPCPTTCTASNKCGPYCWKNAAGSSCGGSSQAPINLVQAEFNEDLEYPEFEAIDSGCDQFHQYADDYGFVVSVEPEPCENLLVKFDGASFTFNSLRVRVPAEHAIGGGINDAELQMVHKTSTGRTLIIAVLLRADSGTGNTFLDTFWKSAVDTAKKAKYQSNVTYSYEYEVHLHGTTFNPYKSILPASRNFFYYSGSVTSFPCTEGVDWIIFEEAVPISNVDLSHMRQAIQYSPDRVVYGSFDYRNTRPLQSVGDRKVYKYDVYSKQNSTKKDKLLWDISIASIIIGGLSLIISTAVAISAVVWTCSSRTRRATTTATKPLTPVAV